MSMKRWGAVLLGLTMMVTVNVRGVELNPTCHRLYEMFQMSDLTYEDVGKIADHMHKNNCWPAMQGIVPDTALNAPPPITDCTSLRAAVWDLGSARDNDSQWHWIKLYPATPVSIINDPERLKNLQNARGIRTLAAATNRHAGIFEGRGKYDALLDDLIAGSTRVLECEAQVRTVGHGAVQLYMYLDRDADGEELYGYVYIGS